MESLKKHWYSVPPTVRKPIILLIGMFFVIISPFTGVLPGPGGIPVFLVGIAILSTEFEWAKRLRDWAIDKIRWLGSLWRAHKILGSLVFVVCFAAIVAATVFSYRIFMR